MTDQQVVAAYRQALVDGDAGALVELFGPQPRFVSPFSVWSTREAVAAACTARTRAFRDVSVGVTSAGDGAGFVRWRGLVGEHEAEGVDVLAVGSDGVSSVDVFLRPADVLDAVYAAMVAAWPRR